MQHVQPEEARLQEPQPDLLGSNAALERVDIFVGIRPWPGISKTPTSLSCAHELPSVSALLWGYSLPAGQKLQWGRGRFTSRFTWAAHGLQHRCGQVGSEAAGPRLQEKPWARGLQQKEAKLKFPQGALKSCAFGGDDTEISCLQTCPFSCFLVGAGVQPPCSTRMG